MIITQEGTPVPSRSILPSEVFLNLDYRADHPIDQAFHLNSPPSPLFALDVQRGGMPGRPGAYFHPPSILSISFGWGYILPRSKIQGKIYLLSSCFLKSFARYGFEMEIDLSEEGEGLRGNKRV